MSDDDDLVARLDAAILRGTGVAFEVAAATAVALAVAACMGLSIMLWAMGERAVAALPTTGMLAGCVLAYFYFRSRPWALKLAIVWVATACAGAYWWLYHSTIIDYH